ncbi:hypothetical protein Pmar_PMAR006023 [Perkinsus marinus ATCC 50983]|uniref:Uncharacterized protein n=1 Tax=Perkinsus marinus (strain ATCC 50983 / TXsc) TaxID=423536 RepID=C5LA02_PERM5|nr:hypothetical protein Pmar_PMAR004488 [Perkinsus marinus ATCC 50983]XP_002774442.1 hypothetical protein Pmar_PMAR006023 [Perkinsus marinus ATCC 50983]EEQ97749.1 hypothetical protein Pmar_PMAR004488 [Perkinsus marinus ATCC 50983]EER06258.1 hypothetical protein Pmar_PMAR006023 [Perkinsus marinus ATCC 50983]|eukprot:XP_002765032.1 hypothetical protein Pmar_PMAR004488 [Perkinsus marinus ATCC 50983]
METIVRVGRDVSHVCVHDDVVYYADGKIKQLRRWSIRDSAELSSLNLPGSLAMLCSLPSGVFVVLSNTNRVYRLQPPSYSWLYQLEFDGPLLSFDTTTMDEDYFLYIPDHLIGDRPVGEVCLTTVSSDVLITTIAGATAARFVPNTDAFASVCCLFADELSCTVCLVDLIRQTTLSYSTPFMGWDVWSMAITDEWQVLVVVEESEDGVGGPNFSPGPFNAVTLRCNP